MPPFVLLFIYIYLLTKKNVGYLDPCFSALLNAKSGEEASRGEPKLSTPLLNNFSIIKQVMSMHWCMYVCRPIKL